MSYARFQEPKVTAVRVESVLNELGMVLKADFDEAGVKLKLEGTPDRILADEEMLRQTLTNLLLNSLKASQGPVKSGPDRYGVP